MSITKPKTAADDPHDHPLDPAATPFYVVTKDVGFIGGPVRVGQEVAWRGWPKGQLLHSLEPVNEPAGA